MPIRHTMHKLGECATEVPGPRQATEGLRHRQAQSEFDLIIAVAGRGKDAAKEHDEILDALSKGDASAATLAMRKHIESGWSLLKST